MMNKQISLTAGFLLALVAGAGAQGLLSIGHADDFESRIPFQTTIGVDFGWDSNPGNRPDGAEEDSAYVRGGIDAVYSNGSRTTNFSLNAGFSTIYYFDAPAESEDDTFYSARVGANLYHRVNRRLTVGDNLYFTYEIEPDHYVGASASRRLEQYLYGYNSVWASYAWNRRFSTVSRYTFMGIDYEESENSFAEDRLTHTFSQEMRYVLNRLTTLVGDVRYAMTEYDTGGRDYDSLYLLAGVDHAFSSTLRGTLRVGAENRDHESRGDSWRPYGEASLRYKAAEHTNLIWFNRIGYEDSELGASAFDTRYVYRSALTVQHRFTERMRGNAGVTYTHSEYEGGSRDDLSEDLISLRLGVGYRVWSNVDLTAGYNFTLLSSEEELREYDRHRLSAGMKVTF